MGLAIGKSFKNLQTANEEEKNSKPFVFRMRICI